MTWACKYLLLFFSTAFFLIPPHGHPSSFHPHVKKPLPSSQVPSKIFHAFLVSIAWRSFSWFKTSFKDRDGREVKWGSRSLTWLSLIPWSLTKGGCPVCLGFLDRQVAIKGAPAWQERGRGIPEVRHRSVLKRPANWDGDCFAGSLWQVMTENPTRHFSRHLCGQMTASTRCLSLMSGTVWSL